MRILILIGLLFLSACSSIQYAGNASYSVEPVQVSGDDGKPRTICCKVSVINGKEIARLEAHIEKSGDDYTVDLKEVGVKAFEGQAIAAGAAQTMIKDAAAAAAAATLAPLIPLMAPAAAAALASPGIGAAAVGAGAVIVKDQVSP